VTGPEPPVAAAAPAAPAAEEGPPAAPPPRPPRRRSLGAALVAWLVPGFGHLVLGQWLRGMAFTGLVGATAAAGVALRGRLYWFGYGVTPAPFDDLATPESPVLLTVASLVSLGLGLPAMALRWIVGYQGELTAPGFEYGTAFLLTAGLMNLLLVLDVWGAARQEAAAEAP
jgi:hypothetical protein